MNPDTLVAHGAALPPWSPFAVTTGIILGFLAGVYCMALYALWLRRTPRPDPAFDAEAHEAIARALDFRGVSDA